MRIRLVVPFLLALLVTICLLVGCGERPRQAEAASAGTPVAVQVQSVAAAE